MLNGRLRSNAIGILIRQSTFFMDNRLLLSWGSGGRGAVSSKKIQQGSTKKPVRVVQMVFGVCLKNICNEVCFVVVCYGLNRKKQRKKNDTFRVFLSRNEEQNLRKFLRRIGPYCEVQSKKRIFVLCTLGFRNELIHTTPSSNVGRLQNIPHIVGEKG